MNTVFLENLKEHNELFNSLSNIAEEVSDVICVCVSCIKSGGKLMFCGNGGSAADSQHLAAEFTGRFLKDRRPLPAISLTTDTSALTCIGNDYSFDKIFGRQVSAIGSCGDCLIAISTSGNSKNIIEAVAASNTLGIKTIGFLGRDGGILKDICSLSIIVPSFNTARIQEAHILIGHTICAAIELELFGQ